MVRNTKGKKGKKADSHSTKTKKQDQVETKKGVPEEEEEEEHIEEVTGDQEGRSVQLNREQDVIFCSNWISNTKYTVLTFIPKNLSEQFRRLANLYFLTIGVISVTPLSPWPGGSIWAALIFVLLANMAKEGHEDWKRRVQDRHINHQESEVLRGKDFIPVRWQDIQVGDIVKVYKDQDIPADLLLLSSNLHQGNCFVSTSNLDGEANLKIRSPLKATSHITSVELLQSLKGTVNCEDPQPKLHQFNGSLLLENQSSAIPLGIEQLLVRATTLKNTKWIYGVVVYTGHETKSLLNTTFLPSKRSKIEKTLNVMIAVLLVMEILLSLICAILGGVLESAMFSGAWYLQSDTSTFLVTIKRTFTFIVLYSSMVPISLYVSVELMRVCQTFFLNQDSKMYDQKNDIQARCSNSNINEELGQIKYIFADKTGTLTSNEMALQMCSIGGHIYGEPPDEAHSQDTHFKDAKLVEILACKKEKAEIISQFLDVLALCHTVIPDHQDEDIVFEASSPDELALVNGAKELGFFFNERTSETLDVNVLGKQKRVDLLNVLDFTSDRRRMSVICRMDDGRIVLLCKGADSVIYELLAANQKVAKITQQHLDQFSSAGLRTLCICMKVLDKGEYEEWNKEYHKASVALSNRQERLAAVAEKIERDLVLLGATGIEDKLQDGVPDTIAILIQAGIKLWVLTGDKRETALNVGKSCKLIGQNQKVLFLNAATKEGSAEELLKVGAQLPNTESSQQFALMVDGATMELNLSPDTIENFLSLCRRAYSVICYRCTPLQKSLVVTAVQAHENVVTLAIGDGANDVSMIQQAHVGVGIRGKEGVQAALASDYSIGQFRFLARLLLVQGRWLYWRVSVLVLYFLYKNIVVAMLQFWWAIFTGFSGQTIYDELPGLGYNMVFTALPILVVAIFDKDVAEDVPIRFPEIYKPLQDNVFFNLKLFAYWTFAAVAHSGVIFFVCTLAFSGSTFDSNGCVGGMWMLSVVVYTSAIIVVNLMIAFETKSWTILHHISIWGSILAWFVFLMLYSGVDMTIPMVQNHLPGVVWKLFSSGLFYFTVILATSVAILPVVVFLFLARNCFPYPHQVAAERSKIAKYEFSEEMTEKV